MSRQLVLLAFLLLACVPAASAQSTTDGQWLLMSRRSEGQGDIWALRTGGPDAGAWLRLTATPTEERHPALSPDGRQLAYAARRQRNWDIYLLDLETGEEQRLTDDPHYDGWPSWSPDGATLVFGSMRAKDLDIFTLDPDSLEVANLTASSTAHEFQPSYAPDGESIVFVSTRRGNHDIFRLPVAGGEPEQMTAGEEIGETVPGWSPDGEWLVVLAKAELDRYVARLDPQTGALARQSWTRGERDPVVSPDGREIAWVDERFDGTAILAAGLDGETLPHRIAGGLGVVQDLRWVEAEESSLATMARRVPQEAGPATIEVAPAPEGGLVEVPNLNTPRPILAASVMPSYQALRDRVHSEVGYDFLGRVSETHRPVDFLSDASAFLSWHKGGRAFDTLLYLEDIPPSVARLEVVRDDRHNEVYWRILLQCVQQDGTCGEPLLERPWDFSREARVVESPGKGGHPSAFFAGYWVDFTALAGDFDWTRIASYEDPDFDWRDDRTAIEFWHYEQPDGLKWWAAMQEIYDLATLTDMFDWNEMEETEVQLWEMRSKGVPLPAEVARRPVEIVVP